MPNKMEIPYNWDITDTHATDVIICNMHYSIPSGAVYPSVMSLKIISLCWDAAFLRVEDAVVSRRQQYTQIKTCSCSVEKHEVFM